MPRPRVSFLVPDPLSSFQILVPRSRTRYSFPILVPCSGSSFLVPDPRSLFRILVPRSGSLFLIPDLTYRFITPPSPPLEKEALPSPGIIYTIILFNVGPGNTGPKTRNSLTVTSIVGVAQKPQIITNMRKGTSVVRVSFLPCVLFLFGNP